MKRWYQKKTPEQRRAWVARRDRSIVQTNDRLRYERDKPARIAAMTAYKDDPQKVSARRAVNNAVRDGKLIKQPCQRCDAERVHRHHDDYTKPLDVRWLCPPHHGEEHQRAA